MACYNPNSMSNRTITHVNQVIRRYKKLDERVKMLKYYGYDVQERYLTKYNGVGKVSRKPQCKEYLITIGKAKHHKYNQVYVVIITESNFIVKANIFEKKVYGVINGDKVLLSGGKSLGVAYLRDYDKNLINPRFNVINYAKRFSKKEDAVYIARQLNDMDYEVDIVAEVVEVFDNKM